MIVLAVYLAGIPVAAAYCPPAWRRHPRRIAKYAVTWPVWAVFFGVAVVIDWIEP